METLKLEKFQDSKLDNLQMIKGGAGNTQLNHSDGNSYHDFDDGETVYAGVGDECISWPSGGGSTGTC